MLNIRRIERLFAGQRYPQLLDELVGNGLELPYTLHAGLRHQPVAVVALGLRRMLELSWLACPGADAMARWLLALQQGSGRFPGGIAATAAAAAALGCYARQQQGPLATEASLAHERAIAALAAAQDDEGLLTLDVDEAHECAAISTFALLQLADDPEFHRRVNVAALDAWLEAHHAELPAPIRALHQMACVNPRRRAA